MLRTKTSTAAGAALGFGTDFHVMPSQCMIFAWPVKLPAPAQMSLADTAATASPLIAVDVTRQGHSRAVAVAAVPCRPAAGKPATATAAATATDRIDILVATTPVPAMNQEPASLLPATSMTRSLARRFTHRPGPIPAAGLGR